MNAFLAVVRLTWCRSLRAGLLWSLPPLFFLMSFPFFQDQVEDPALLFRLHASSVLLVEQVFLALLLIYFVLGVIAEERENKQVLTLTAKPLSFLTRMTGMITGFSLVMILMLALISAAALTLDALMTDWNSPTRHAVRAQSLAYWVDNQANQKEILISRKRVDGIYLLAHPLSAGSQKIVFSNSDGHSGQRIDFSIKARGVKGQEKSWQRSWGGESLVMDAPFPVKQWVFLRTGLKEHKAGIHLQAGDRFVAHFPRVPKALALQSDFRRMKDNRPIGLSLIKDDQVLPLQNLKASELSTSQALPRVQKPSSLWHFRLDEWPQSHPLRIKPAMLALRGPDGVAVKDFLAGQVVVASELLFALVLAVILAMILSQPVALLASITLLLCTYHIDLIEAFPDAMVSLSRDDPRDRHRPTQDFEKDQLYHAFEAYAQLMSTVLPHHDWLAPRTLLERGEHIPFSILLWRCGNLFLPMVLLVAIACVLKRNRET